MRWQRPVAMLLVALLAAPGAGCSFLSVRGPPSTPPQTGGARSGEVKCTDHYGAPTGDAFVGTIVAAVSALPITFLAHGVGDIGADLGVSIGSVALAVTLVASSVYGFVQVARCNGAKGATERARARQHAWLPPPGAGPGP